MQIINFRKMTKSSMCDKLRIVAPHFAIIIVFVIYVGLGGVSFYYMVNSRQQYRAKWKDREKGLEARRVPFDESDLVLIGEEDLCPCSAETKIVITREAKDDNGSHKIDEPISWRSKRSTPSPPTAINEWSYYKAFVLSYYYATSIGSGEFYFEDAAEIRFFALIYSLVGVAISFLTFADLGYLFHEAIYLMLNRLKSCHLREPQSFSVNPSKFQRLSRTKSSITIRYSKRVGPLTFVILLLAYCFLGAICFTLLSGSNFFVNFARCGFSVLGISPTKDLLTTLPQWFFVQLFYSFMGFVILSAFFHSLLPIYKKITGAESAKQIVRVVERVPVPDRYGSFYRTRSTGSAFQSRHNLVMCGTTSGNMLFSDDKTSMATSAAFV